MSKYHIVGNHITRPNYLAEFQPNQAIILRLNLFLNLSNSIVSIGSDNNFERIIVIIN